MSIYQVSVFTQSQPGHLLRILNILAEEELNFCLGGATKSARYLAG